MLACFLHIRSTSPLTPIRYTDTDKDTALKSAWYIATLGSILDSLLTWESGEFHLARWNHEVTIFLVRTNLTRPPDCFLVITTDQIFIKFQWETVWNFVWCPHPSITCDQIFCVVSRYRSPFKMSRSSDNRWLLLTWKIICGNLIR